MTSVIRLFYCLFIAITLSCQVQAEGWEDDPKQHLLVEAKFRRWRAETPFGSSRPRKTRVLSLLEGYQNSEDKNLCDLGGNKNRQLGATDFFRTEKVAGRWWLVDPHGHPFIATALNSIRSGQKKDRNPTSVVSFSKQWTGEGDWAESTTQFLADSGFNTIGTWSDPSLRDVDRALPWTTVLYVMYPLVHNAEGSRMRVT
jgi:hypothetical protein